MDVIYSMQDRKTGELLVAFDRAGEAVLTTKGTEARCYCSICAPLWVQSHSGYMAVVNLIAYEEACNHNGMELLCFDCGDQS